jgi:hypothetical protein
MSNTEDEIREPSTGYPVPCDRAIEHRPGELPPPDLGDGIPIFRLPPPCSKAGILDRPIPEPRLSWLLELMTALGAAAIGWACLPSGLAGVNAILVAAIFVASRLRFQPLGPIDQLPLVSIVLLLFVPALRSNDPWDWDMAVAASLLLFPLLLRLLTWWDRTERWDLLDPLVVVCTPSAFVFVLVIVARLFEMGCSTLEPARPDPPDAPAAASEADARGREPSPAAWPADDREPQTIDGK